MPSKKKYFTKSKGNGSNEPITKSQTKRVVKHVVADEAKSFEKPIEEQKKIEKPQEKESSVRRALKKGF